jgi:hypothetical protein
MQVYQLIEQLEYLDPNAEVHFSYCYGDHWRTEVAPKVDRISEGTVVYSEYHRMDKIAEHDDSDFDEETGEEIVDETLRRVVVLS